MTRIQLEDRRDELLRAAENLAGLLALASDHPDGPTEDFVGRCACSIKNLIGMARALSLEEAD